MKQVDLNLINEKIKFIEENFDVNNFVIKEINLWPLIRKEIIKELYPVDFGDKIKTSITSKLLHIIDLIKAFKFWELQGRNLFLMYGTDRSGKLVLENQLIDKHFTPFKYKFGPENVIFIEFGVIDSLVPKSEALNVTLLYYIISPIIKFYFRVTLKKPISKLFSARTNFEAIKVSSLSPLIIEFFSRQVFFYYMLKWIIKPKNVFVKSFNNITAMALVYAANKLKVNTIEFQHGQQGENSLTYSNWNNVPKQGFKLVPKYFWVWENRFKKKLNHWMQFQDFHRVIVGGSLWYDYILTKKKIHKSLFSKNYNHVLYCLQYSELNEIVVNAIKSSKGIVWHIRLHPREVKKIDLISSELQKMGIDRQKYDLTSANKYGFDFIVPHMNAVVSEWSTVLYEAYCYQKKAITISLYGKKAYEEFINERCILYAKNSKKLLDIIYDNSLKNNLFTPTINEENFEFLQIKSV